MPHASAVSERASKGATVPATLSLTLGSAPAFGAFTPALARDYETTGTATVTSTAGDAALSVVDPSSVTPGKLINGAYALAQPLQVKATSAGALGARAQAAEARVNSARPEMKTRRRPRRSPSAAAVMMPAANAMP